eukprot:6559288-Alexandrium_andersonii.AAC.1
MRRRKRGTCYPTQHHDGARATQIREAERVFQHRQSEPLNPVALVRAALGETGGTRLLFDANDVAVSPAGQGIAPDLRTELLRAIA